MAKKKPVEEIVIEEIETVPNNVPETVNKDTVSVMFRENRKFDLHIGREMVTFNARERKDIPRKWLKHKDWNNVLKYFIVKGV